jgi:hypothetical protein
MENTSHYREFFNYNFANTLDPIRCISSYIIAISLIGLTVLGSINHVQAENASQNIIPNPNASQNIPTLTTLKGIDTILKADLTASLAGLALAAASFLYGYNFTVGNIAEVTTKNKLDQAKKDLIYSFFALVICTLVVFGFDMAEEGIGNHSGLSYDTELVDAVSKYGLFMAGLFFLGKGARNLYRSLVGGSGSIQPPEESKILGALTKSTSISIEDIAKKVLMRDDVVETIVKDLVKKHIVKETGHWNKKYMLI